MPARASGAAAWRVGPTLAAVLSMSATTGTAERGVPLAFGYRIGLRLPFLLVALAFRRALRVFGFTRRRARTIMRIGGAMLIVVGILLVTGVWMYFTGQLRYWVAGYQLPL
ncbi:cytochrome c biogenesis protein CcdA [Streptomyces sp. NPDC005393]|uniref:cytochrome c biogenesis protein CcdA n=1 Tax=Streptomyces sp. NPDC005393 TaxID=3157041 RepID=UPI0033AEB209